MLKYYYITKDYRSWLQGFAQLIKTKVQKGKVYIPERFGDGYVYAKIVTPGVSYILMDFSIKQELVFHEIGRMSNGFCLFLNMEEISLYWKSNTLGEEITEGRSSRSNFHFSSTEYPAEITYSPNSSIRRFGLFFSLEFLIGNIDPHHIKTLRLFAKNMDLHLYPGFIPFRYKTILAEIFDLQWSGPNFNHLKIASRAALLIDFLLNEMARLQVKPGGLKGNEKDELLWNATLQHNLKEVEDVLSQDTLLVFPSITKLAQVAGMCTTLLKSKFKQEYGLTLYGFFLQKRMERAKKLLETGKYLSYEVANMIGFANHSQFANAYRKAWGMLPKDQLNSINSNQCVN